MRMSYDGCTNLNITSLEDMLLKPTMAVDCPTWHNHYSLANHLFEEKSLSTVRYKSHSNRTKVSHRLRLPLEPRTCQLELRFTSFNPLLLHVKCVSYDTMLTPVDVVSVLEIFAVTAFCFLQSREISILSATAMKM